MNDFGVLFHQNAKTIFSNSTISKIASRYCGGSAPYIQHLIILFWVASDNGGVPEKS